MRQLHEFSERKQIDAWKITAMLTAIACIAGAPSWAGDSTVPGSFATIQAAIDDAGTVAGDTITVSAGTYTENVVLNKSVSLVGAKAGVDACGRDGTGETIIDAGGALGIKLVSGSAGATIDGFTIIDASRAIDSASGPIHNLTLQNNRLPDFTSAGIFLNDIGDDITLHQNYVDGSSGGGGTGIHLDQDPMDGMHITDNCVSNTNTGIFSDSNRDVGLSANRSPLMSGNLLTGNLGVGANLGRKSWEYATISDNVFADNDFDGLQGGPASSAITGNVFANNGRYGLALTGFGGSGDSTRGAQDNDINSNCIVGSGTAGVLYSSGQFPGTQASNMVNGNNIRGNAVGALYGGTETLDAESNWWGASDGPSAPDGSGSGDSVDGAGGGGTIDFTPFETSELDLPCNAYFPTVYTCDGFEPPMNLAFLPPAMGGGPIGRRVKKNKVLPFKATLLDGDGNPVTDLIAPPAIQVFYGAGPPIPSADVSDEAFSNGKRTDGNEFILAGDKWSYNLATKNFTAVGTYRAFMVSGDESEYVIDPECEGLFVIETR